MVSTDSHPAGNGKVTVTATGGIIEGNGKAKDVARIEHIHVVNSTTGFASMYMELEAIEGTLDDCKPEIQCEIQPLFRGYVEINEPGHAHVDGIIDVTTDLGDHVICHKQGKTTTVLALAVGRNARPKVNFGVGASVGKDGPGASVGGSVETEFASGSKQEKDSSVAKSDVTISSTLPRNNNNKLEKVFVKVAVASQLTIDLKAETSFWWNWYALAKGWIKNANPNIKITGRCRSGACEEVVYTYPEKAK